MMKINLFDVDKLYFFIKIHLLLSIMWVPIAQAGLRSDITVVYTPPSCNLKAPPEVDLGDLLLGSRNHQPITLSLTCDSAVETAITMESGTRFDDTTALMSNNATKLWFTEPGGTKLRLTGQRADAFCTGNTAMQTCEITPHTEMKNSDSKGTIYTILKLNFIYK